MDRAQVPDAVDIAPAIRSAVAARRDLNYPRGVVAGGIPGALRPLSRADAAASSHPVVARPGVSWCFP
jgi:hypothetical protein